MNELEGYGFGSDIPVGSADHINYPKVLELIHSVSAPWGECSPFSAAEATCPTPIIIQPGALYCWVARGGVDSKIAHGFYIHITSAMEIEPLTP